MGYIENNLTNGEVIKYRAKIHWAIYTWPSIWFLFALLLLVSGGNSAPFSWVFFILALFLGLRSFIIVKSSEFVLTTKRVIMKSGFLRRNSTDVLLAKLESFNVDQGFIGRIFNYGTFIVGGTGSAGGFKTIADPLEFRKRVQSEMELISK